MDTKYFTKQDFTDSNSEIFKELDILREKIMDIDDITDNIDKIYHQLIHRLAIMEDNDVITFTEIKANYIYKINLLIEHLKSNKKKKGE